MKLTHLFGAVLFSAAVIPAHAWAQAPGLPPITAPGTAPGAAPNTAAAPDDAQLTRAIDQRIGALQSKLVITSAQTADWTAFAQAMRDNATSTNQLFAQRAQTAAAMSAVDNMTSYAAIARAYADNTEKLASAFASLYAKLSPDQQKTADQLFRQPPRPATRSRH